MYLCAWLCVCVCLFGKDLLFSAPRNSHNGCAHKHVHTHFRRAVLKKNLSTYPSPYPLRRLTNKQKRKQTHNHTFAIFYGLKYLPHMPEQIPLSLRHRIHTKLHTKLQGSSKSARTRKIDYIHFLLCYRRRSEWRQRSKHIVRKYYSQQADDDNADDN